MKNFFKTRRKRKILIITLAIVTVFAVSINAFSLWQSERSIHINPKDIPPSTLAIGTHLIHINALTNVHYEVAMKAATESNQPNIYYKSELADGTWFDITAGSTITDITTGDNSVPDSVIRELFFDYHTKENGVTTDLRTGATVNIFNISNPYNLESMPELMPLKLAYDLEKELGDDDDKIEFMDRVLKAYVQTGETYKLDSYLAALDRYYKVLNDNNGTQANKETVMQVQQSVDASRRVIVFEKVDALLSDDIQVLVENEEKDIYDSKGKVIDTIEPIEAPELRKPLEDSKTNVQTSLLEQISKALVEGTSILSKMKYGFQMNLVDDAVANNHSACDADVANIQALDNISTGRILERERELSILENSLIPQGEAAFESDIKSGVNQEYRKAVADRSSSVILDKIANAYYNKLSSEVTELEMYLDGKCARVENSAAQELITNKLEAAYKYEATVPNDAFNLKANQAIQEYIMWLEGKLASLIAAAGGTEADMLGQRKADLTEEYLAALDKNDLAGAKALMTEINGLATQIAELGGESKESKLIKDMIDEAKNLISDDNTGNQTPDPNLDRLSDILSALDSMMVANSQNAFPAMQEISDAMKAQKYGAGLGTGGSGSGSGSGSGTDGTGTGGTGAGAGGNNMFDSLISKAGDSILANQGLYEATNVGIQDPADMGGIMDDFLLGIDGMGDNEKALIKMTALNKLLLAMPGNKYYDQISAQMSNIAATESIKGNPYVFAKMKVMEGVYAPVTAVSAKTGLRYVWYLSRDNAVLAKGSQRYEFTAFSKQVVKDNVAEEMSLPALSQKILYIPAGYINSEWSYLTINLIGSDYGILIDNDIDKYAEELLGLLQK